MRTRNYPPELVYKVINEIENGLTVKEAEKKYKVTKQTIYKWRASYEKREKNEALRLLQLQDENTTLKMMYANLAIELVSFKLKINPNEQCLHSLG